MKEESKYMAFKDAIIDIYQENPLLNYTQIGERAQIEAGLEPNVNSQFRRIIKKLVTGLPYKAGKRRMVTTSEKYNAQGNLTSSTDKLQAKPVEIPADHEIFAISTNATTGQQWIKTRKKEVPDDKSIQNNLTLLKKLIKGYKPILNRSFTHNDTEGVVVISDIHWGAYVNGLTIGEDFDVNILLGFFERISNITNSRQFKKVHFIFTGDLIESFSGMNHPNSWQGIEQNEFGVRAVKNLVDALSKNLFEKTNNVGSIKIVAGNHDRLSSSNKEDVRGGAAEFVAWGLNLLDYDVEFSPDIISAEIDGINYIINHGHLPLTKKLTTNEICWRYGKKGMFNYILEGHLHSRILKLTATQIKNFKLILDDANDNRRQIAPSLFRGNFYSETLGYTSTAGFLLIYKTHPTHSKANMPKPTVEDHPL